MGHTGVPEATTVGFHADLDEAFTLLLAHRLDAQYRGVGVSPDHGNRVARLGSWLNGRISEINQ